jgi:rhamnose transport system substrate-binding protein
MIRKVFAVLLVLSFMLTACAPAATPAPTQPPQSPPQAESGGKKFRVIAAPKLIGIDYYASVFDGMKEAANELGDINFDVQGPIKSDAEQQIQMIDSMITTKPDAILLAANDPQALAPVMKRAMAAGIKVVSFDADTLPEARNYFINQASFEGIGKALLDEVKNQKGDKAKFAIISSTPNAPNQNAWIDELKKYQAASLPNMQLVDIQYGEDNVELSRQKANDLMTAHPDLEAIIEPSAGGCPGLAEAVDSAGKAGKVAVVCLATPNGMRDYVKKGVAEAIILWNTVDLGYMTMYVAEALLTGKLKEGDTTVDVGRMGTRDISPTNEILLGPPFRFTKDNIDQFQF